MGLKARFSIDKKFQGNSPRKAQAPRCFHSPCTEHHTSKLLSVELYSSTPTLCPLPHSSLCQLTILHGTPKRKISVHSPNTSCWVKQQQLLLLTGLRWLEVAAVTYHYQNSKSSDTDLNLPPKGSCSNDWAPGHITDGMATDGQDRVNKKP